MTDLTHESEASVYNWPDVLEKCRARIAALEALRCDCDEDSGQHAPSCTVSIRDVNAAMADRIAELEAEREAFVRELEDIADDSVRDAITRAIAAVKAARGEK